MSFDVVFFVLRLMCVDYLVFNYCDILWDIVKNRNEFKWDCWFGKRIMIRIDLVVLKVLFVGRLF